MPTGEHGGEECEGVPNIKYRLWYPLASRYSSPCCICALPSAYRYQCIRPNTMSGGSHTSKTFSAPELALESSFYPSTPDGTFLCVKGEPKSPVRNLNQLVARPIGQLGFIYAFRFVLLLV